MANINKIQVGGQDYNIEDASALHSIPAATSTALGGVKSGGNITVATDGTVTVNNATNATSATTATKLSTSAGNTSTPIYFSGGKPAVLPYTIEKSVPADAKFTDTVYTHPANHTASVINGLTPNTVAIGNASGVLASSAVTTTELESLDGITGNIEERLDTLETKSTPEPGTTTPKVAGTAAVGTSSKYAREDHVHPVQTTVATANKVANALKISHNGEVKGTFDGSAATDVSLITVGQYDPTHLENSTPGEIFGGATSATGIFAHAEGAQTTADGNYSHSEGFGCKAIGAASHAGGQGSISEGDQSFAHGEGVNANGENSTAFGYRTKTTNVNEFACGQYNNSVSSKTLFSVGMSPSSTTRINALEVHKLGDTFIYGINGYDGTNPSDETALNYSKKMLEIPKFVLIDNIENIKVSSGYRYLLDLRNKFVDQNIIVDIGYNTDKEPNKPIIVALPNINKITPGTHIKIFTRIFLSLYVYSYTTNSFNSSSNIVVPGGSEISIIKHPSFTCTNNTCVNKTSSRVQIAKPSDDTIPVEIDIMCVESLYSYELPNSPQTDKRWIVSAHQMCK